MRLIIAIALVLMCFRSVAYAYEGRRANSVLLNGVWEFVLGDGDEGDETVDGQAELAWQEVALPGQFMPWNQDLAATIKFVWARRRFHISEAQAESLAVLKWNYISLGAVAFINGRKVGENRVECTSHCRYHVRYVHLTNDRARSILSMIGIPPRYCTWDEEEPRQEGEERTWRFPFLRERPVYL